MMTDDRMEDEEDNDAEEQDTEIVASFARMTAACGNNSAASAGSQRP